MATQAMTTETIIVQLNETYISALRKALDSVSGKGKNKWFQKIEKAFTASVGDAHEQVVNVLAKIEPPKTPRKKAPKLKDPNAPARATTAYRLFCARERKKNPQLSRQAVNDKWAELKNSADANSQKLLKKLQTEAAKTRHVTKPK